LFLELGVDTSKFSKDQRAALDKIAQFESQTKRAAGNARGQIQTVGDAFRDLTKDSRVGSSAAGIDNLATKLKNLGMSMQVSGGVGTPLGGMARGLGMLLSPAALGAAAIGLVAKEVWDLNKSETTLFATLKRNSELTGTSAANLFSLGLAAKTVGGDPAAVQAAIVQRDTALAGMSIGVGSAVPQLIGMARLRQFGARFNPGGFGQGADEESLFKAVNAYFKQNGRAKTMALTQGYGLMSADETDLAMSKNGWQEYQDTRAKVRAMKTGGGFEEVVRNSLKSQQGLGENDIAGSVNAAEAYGGIQQPMQTIVGLLTDIRAFISAILNGLSSVFHWAKVITPSNATKDTLASTVNSLVTAVGLKAPFSAEALMTERASIGKKTLMDLGLSADEAAAVIGNQMRESSMNPLSVNASGHRGIGQWDANRQSAYSKRFGYQIGSSDVSAAQQLIDQEKFTVQELLTSHRPALEAMKKAKTLLGKTGAFNDLFEVSGDSIGKRFSYAQLALNLPAIQDLLAASNARNSGSVQHTVTSETNIGDVHLHTNATDPASHATAFRDGISKQPLVGLSALVDLSLSTRATVL